ncbi:hypothetical protein KSC_106170 [Ktedonobacter sp. SOSP1-52]|uniref:LuxR C-terminal-related transcriptional regulator n=1 Tax=Ktedonobacter sp. SOSP1-52 TaxID=2778366 RepID=UPI001914FA53|nr:LuxR C-terminal-related transcriptional regulator [Ktedonobacter sp. SOSP1-52]GHO71725.1 hypothetical protein KSC_106170 [Ktedonobacter sp. SOSP1-52]
MPKPSLRVLAWSQANQIYEYRIENTPQGSISPEDEPSWQQWLLTQSSFTFQGKQGHLNVMKEARIRGAGYWYAYAYTPQRRIKRYLGKTESITLARLESIAHELTPEHNTLLTQRMLLLPKLLPPRLSNNEIIRDRLLTRLNQSLTRPLTVIVAPAGFGKTILLSSWVAHCPHAIAWVSLEESDDEPVRFWHYVIAALQHASGSQIGAMALALLQSPQAPAFPIVLTSFINDLTGLAKDLILVLDDYHVLTDGIIHDGVRFLLTHLPPQLHLVIASRTNPPFPLSRLRVRGQLVELGEQDLRFVRAEMEAFLLQKMRLHLDADVITTLEQRTEGWIAGLQLATLALQTCEDASSFLQQLSGSQRLILDYIQEEILAHQPLQLQRFLLSTSILSNLHPDLCQAVSEEAESQRLLTEMERRHLFLVPLEGKQHWYRLHSLFRDALLAHLQATAPAQLPLLHQRASHWYEQHGYSVKAIHHAFAAADYEYAVQLIEHVATHMWTGSEANQVQDWMSQLPMPVLRRHAHLALTTALHSLHQTQIASQARRTSVQAQVEQTIAQIEEIIEQQDTTALPEDERRVLHNRIGLLRAWIETRGTLFQGNEKEQRRLAHIMQELAQDEEVIWKMLPAFNFYDSGWAYGDFVSQLPTLWELKQQAEREQQPYEVIWIMVWLATIYLDTGQLHYSYQITQESLARSERLGVMRAMFASLRHRLATIYVKWNRLEEAESYLKVVIRYSQTWQHVSLFLQGNYLAISIFLAQGRHEEAIQALQEINLLRKQSFHSAVHALGDLGQIQIWLAQGNSRAAEKWAEQIVVNSQRIQHLDEITYMKYLWSRRVYLALGRHTEVLDFCAQFLPVLEHEQRGDGVLDVLALQVVAYECAGYLHEACEVAERLLRLSEPEGYIRVYLDAGEPMRRVLQSLLDTHTSFEATLLPYLRTLLTAFEQQGASSKSVASTPLPTLQITPPALREPLTARENEVLHLLAQGASNREIAQELVVSPATAKKHVYNILGKLGVQSRVQALVRAQEYALL